MKSFGEIHNIIRAADIPTLLEKEALFTASHPDYSVSFRRYFLSSAEQTDKIGPVDSPVSYVIQPVLGEDSVAVWVFLTKDCPVELLWHTNLCRTSGDAEEQTVEIFRSYEKELAGAGLCIADHCVRTWLYVDDIDNDYPAVASGRKNNFEMQGMTKDTHYLASTGIRGGCITEGAKLQMDALAIKGEFSQHYLYAPDNFNPTHEYGVTFERGVAVEYGGVSHILISGTASINNKGEIVHPGDPLAQTLHMLRNVEALLDEAGSGWNDVRMAVVYLRNADDYGTVSSALKERFGTKIPYVITLAPVCRPGWLIEMECISVAK